MSQVFLNNYSTRLSSAIAAADTSIVVDQAPPALGAGDFYTLTIADKAGAQEPEIVKVTAVSGNTLDIVRAQENTTAQDWATSTPIEMRLTSAGLAQAVADNAPDDLLNYVEA